MRKELAICLISLISFVLFFHTRAVAQNTVLKGINCKLETTERTIHFQKPTKPLSGKDWVVTNDFGNVVTNKDVPGLPDGYWQHTGIDYLLNGRSVDSQGQMIYAAGGGVVAFSTASNPNPLLKRGGLVIIRHLAPVGGSYQIPKYERTVRFGNESATITYGSYQTNEILTYYLHLDPDQVLVKQGDQVKAGQPIGRLYHSKDVPSRFVYVPHLHFEVWTRCEDVERNGYDLPGDKQFQKVVTNPLIDPSSFLSSNLSSSSTPTPTAIPTSSPSTFQRFYLEGEWIATGYPDVGEIRIRVRQAGDKVEAIKLTSGNSNVPAGAVTWFGTYTSNRFFGKIQAADAGFTNRRLVEIIIVVSDDRHLVVTMISDDPVTGQRFGPLKFEKVK